ncbi:MAG: DNA-binding protein [Nitrospirae bacterium]|nr:MAG: DNA-binding protein [Nitrospirota bacterium]
MKNMNPQEKLLKPQELAEKLGISRHTVLRLAKQQKIPCQRLGTKIIRFEWEKVCKILYGNSDDKTEQLPHP